jgi:hypothetical protein
LHAARGGIVATNTIIGTSALALLVSVLPAVEGCGAIFLGKTQQITLRTTPPGAVASLTGEQTTTPGSVTIRRNQPRGWAVLRAEHPGYRPACQLVGGQRKVGFIVMDCFLLAMPLLVDASTVGLASMRTYPDEVHLTLHPLAEGEPPKSLPSDEEVLEAWRMGRVNLCNPNAGRRPPASVDDGPRN